MVNTELDGNRVTEARENAVRPHWANVCRWLIVLAYAAAIADYLWLSRGWPLVHDTTVIHYVSFLIDRGWAPYREIGDMNMPGAYLFEGWALHLFGSSDVGWRVYDFVLCAVSVGAMFSVSRRYDWLAGVVAGGTFVLVHASEGPMSAGQRDELMAVLLLAGYAFCFEAVRRKVSWLMFPCGLLCAMAASVKPTLLLLGPILFAVVWKELRKRRETQARYGLWMLAGYGVAGAVVLRFLLVHGAFDAFFRDVTTILPHYATVAAASWGTLLRLMLQTPMFIYLGCALAAALLDRNWGDWECQALLVGVGAGLFNFFAQRKGFGQHRYTTVAFALLWGTIQIFRSLERRGRGRVFAAAGLLFVVLVDIPRNLQWTHRQKRTDEFSATLEQDLARFGVQRLQRQVQCLDIVDGCLNALFHLKIEQSNGSTGDLLLFLPQPSPVVDEARAKFLAEIRVNPPEVIVLTNEAFAGARSFRKVDYWPEFAKFLQERYPQILVQREFGDGSVASHPWLDTDVKAYRILMRR